MRLSFIMAFIFIISFLLITSPPLSSRVRDTKHNLSVSGPGQIKATSETEICIFCHTPHNASPAVPLWNHDPSAVTNYINYWSPTLQAYPSETQAPPIDGYSKLCLSCHDGSIAIGAVRSRQEDIEMVTIANIIESGRLMPGAQGYLGTDLSGGHPISFIFDEALVTKRNSQPGLSRLKWPITDRDVRLYPTQGGYGVQCSSCHDPHGTKGGPNEPPLWRKATFDEVCLVCHESIEYIGH
jgi:predicted CXXCH cytochrome family protein